MKAAAALLLAAAPIAVKGMPQYAQQIPNGGSRIPKPISCGET